MNSKKLLLGAHVSIAGGLDKAFARAEEVGCTAMQIFTKNAGQWQGKPLGGLAAEAFGNAWSVSAIGPVIAHDSYLINLATPDDDAWEKSKAAFLDEMERCALLGIPQIGNASGGSCRQWQSGRESSGLLPLSRIFSARAPKGGRNSVWKIRPGKGTCLGNSRFEELAAIMAGFSGAHLWGLFRHLPRFCRRATIFPIMQRLRGGHG